MCALAAADPLITSQRITVMACRFEELTTASPARRSGGCPAAPTPSPGPATPRRPRVRYVAYAVIVVALLGAAAFARPSDAPTSERPPTTITVDTDSTPAAQTTAATSTHVDTPTTGADSAIAPTGDQAVETSPHPQSSVTPRLTTSTHATDPAEQAELVDDPDTHRSPRATSPPSSPWPRSTIATTPPTTTGAAPSPTGPPPTSSTRGATT